MALSVERSAPRLAQADQRTLPPPGVAGRARIVDPNAERWEGVRAATRDLVKAVRDNPGKTALVTGGVIAAGLMFPVVGVVMTGVGIATTGYAAAKAVISESRAASAARRGDTDAQRALLRESGSSLFGVAVGVAGVGLGRAANALSRSNALTKAATPNATQNAAAAGGATATPLKSAETVTAPIASGEVAGGVPTAPVHSLTTVAAPSVQGASDAPIRNLGLYRDSAKSYVRELREQNTIRTGLFGVERELQDAARAYPTSGSSDFGAYLTTRLDTAVAIEKRYLDGIRTASGSGFDGPRADRALMVRFAQQTELHRRNVDAGLARLTGEGRGFRTPHDVHEVRPLDEVAELAARPDAPKWLTSLVARTRAEGHSTFDVGKADPYVMAGLSQTGRAEKYSIVLHRLSPHHADTPMSYEGAFDYVNALRMPRFYGTGRVRSFNDIWAIARENALERRNGMRVDDLPRIQEAMRAHHALEHESLITTYFKQAAPELLPDFMRGAQ